MKKQLFVCLLIVFNFAGAVLKAQNPAPGTTVKVTGEVKTPLTINESELLKYNQVNITRKDKDGKDHTYSGVKIADILLKAGATLGADLKGKNLMKYLLVEAADGYKVVFALPELDGLFTDRNIILANRVDGQPLAAGDGPFRIIVENEKKPARCVKQVTMLKVIITQ